MCTGGFKQITYNKILLTYISHFRIARLLCFAACIARPIAFECGKREGAIDWLDLLKGYALHGTDRLRE